MSHRLHSNSVESVSDAKAVTASDNADGLERPRRGGASWSHLLNPLVRTPRKFRSKDTESKRRSELMEQDASAVKTYSPDVLTETEVAFLKASGVDREQLLAVHMILPSDESKALIRVGSRYVEYKKTE